MTNLTVKNLVSKLHEGLIPEVSKYKYDKAWENIEKWLTSQDPPLEVSEDTVMAYAVNLHTSG